MHKIATMAVAVLALTGMVMTPASGQGFTSILDKLGELEEQITALEAAQQHDVKSLRDQLASATPGADVSGLETSVADLRIQVADLGTQLALVQAADRAPAPAAVPETVAAAAPDATGQLAMELRAMIGELQATMTSAPLLRSGAAEPAPAAAGISLDVGNDTYSQYVWRGFVLADGITTQPTITLGFGDSGLAFNIWGSSAVQDRGAGGLDASDELDFTLSYDRSLGTDELVGLSVGFIQYTFPNLDGTKHSEEVYVGLGLDHPVAPSLTAYYDYGLADAWYISAGVGHDFALDSAGSTSLSVASSVGFSNAARTFGFNDVTTTASLGVGWDGLAICPTVGFSYADDAVHGDNSAFFAGVGISVSR